MVKKEKMAPLLMTNKEAKACKSRFCMFAYLYAEWLSNGLQEGEQAA